jgi:DNA-binding transcriptional regulator YdaS (Cro superfamily)
MRFDDYWNNLPAPEKQAFAEACRTSSYYLKLVAAGKRTPKLGLAIEMAKASTGAVTLREILPALDWRFVKRDLSRVRRASRSAASAAA